MNSTTVHDLTSVSLITPTSITDDNATLLNIATTTITLYKRTKKDWKIFLDAFGPGICVFGIVCNIINLLVLTRPELSESPYIYLTGLSCTDLGFLILAFLHLVIAIGNKSYFWVFYDTKIFYPVTNIMYNSSVLIIVLLTVERFLVIYRPLTINPTRMKTRVCIMIVVILSCILNIPRFMIYTIREWGDGYIPSATDFQRSQTFFIIGWIHAVIINIIPLTVLLVSNSYLIYTVRRARKERASLQLRRSNEQESRRDERKLTVTLISIVILFILCTFPSVFAEEPIAYTLFGGDKTWEQFLSSPGNLIFIHISNNLLYLNSSLNFILYCAFNERFRRAMKSLMVNKIFGHCLLITGYRRVRARRSGVSTRTESTAVHDEDSNAAKKQVDIPMKCVE